MPISANGRQMSSQSKKTAEQARARV